MAVTANDLVRVAFKQEYGGIEDVVNVMHFQITTVPGLGSDVLFLQDLGQLAGAMWAEIESAIPTGLNPVDVEAYNITDDGPIGVGNWSGYAGGTATGDAMPLADCMLLIFPTPVKRKQGRIYLSPWNEGSQADGLWSAGALTLAENFMGVLLSNFIGTNGYEFTYVVYSRAGGVASVPSASRIQPRVAYQLRRKPGRGS